MIRNCRASQFRYRHSVVCVLLSSLLLSACGAGRNGSTVTERKRIMLDVEDARLLREGQSALNYGDFQSSMNRAERIVKKLPDFADGWYLEGLVYTQLNQFKEARKVFRKVLELDPRYSGAWFQIGQTEFTEGHFEDAIKYYKKELSLSSRNPSSVLLQIGRARARLESYGLAEKKYTEAIQADSGNALAYQWMGELKMQEGDVESALKYVEKAKILAPNDIENSYLLGTLLLKLGKVSFAVIQFEDVLKKQPWHEGATYNMGRAKLALGEEDEGNRYLARTDSLQFLSGEIGSAELVVYQDPRDPARWKQLIDLLLKAGRKEEAIRAYGAFQYLTSQPSSDSLNVEPQDLQKQ